MSLARLTHDVAKIDLASDGASAMLANLAASYAAERKASEPPPPKPSKLAQIKAQAKAQPEPEGQPAPKPPLTCLILPPAGTMTAEVFLETMRELGPVFVGDSSNLGDPRIVGERNALDFVARRDRAILAIAAYCGYDRYAEFGLQEYNARQRANREVHGVTAAKPKPMVSLHGFIAGMPDMTARRVGDLQGRIRLAYDTAAEREKTACQSLTLDAQGAPCCCQGHFDAAVERNRAKTYEADLSRIVG